MTTERNTAAPAPEPGREDMMQFVFHAASATGLLLAARAMLDSAPRELSESFEQAMRVCGLAS